MPRKAIAMTTLRIEHTVRDYDAWKQMFDSDPADRAGSGVRQYRISRSVADPSLVMIDLDFDDVASAQGLLTKMERIWAGPAANVMIGPRATIVELAEQVEV
jgi:hypothetical protein